MVDFFGAVFGVNRFYGGFLLLFSRAGFESTRDAVDVANMPTGAMTNCTLRVADFVDFHDMITRYENTRNTLY